jgi:hypothetical protein
MQVSTASRSGPGLTMSPSFGSRLRHMEVPMVLLNCPGQSRSWHVDHPPSVSRCLPSASLVVERPSQERSPAVRIPLDSGRTPVRPAHDKVVTSWAPVRESVSVGIPAERVLEESSSLKPLPPQESPTDDPRLGNPLLRMERLSTAWMGVRQRFVFLEACGKLIHITAYHAIPWALNCSPTPL